MVASPIMILAIGAGGAIGAVARFLVGGWVMRSTQSWWPNLGFPLGTLVVNVVGSFLIGVLFAWLDQGVRDPGMRELVHGLVLVGILGGFTTFSTFSLETVQLLGSGLWGKAMLNIIASVVACVVAAMAGLALIRSLG